MKPSFALAAAALALGLAHPASAQEAATQPATAPHPKAPLGRQARRVRRVRKGQRAQALGRLRRCSACQ